MLARGVPPLSCAICSNRKEKRFCLAVHGRILPAMLWRTAGAHARLSLRVSLPAASAPAREAKTTGRRPARGSIPQGRTFRRFPEGPGPSDFGNRGIYLTPLATTGCGFALFSLSHRLNPL